MQRNTGTTCTKSNGLSGKQGLFISTNYRPCSKIENGSGRNWSKVKSSDDIKVALGWAKEEAERPSGPFESIYMVSAKDETAAKYSRALLSNFTAK
ncbi:hypothetical protein KM043_007127 [Ampulex compressa]|nr:hypothetical protein KM043_007127 [Ampulex compressa]